LLHGVGFTVVGLGRGARENAPLPWLSEYHQIELPSPRVVELLTRTRPDIIVHCAGRASVESSFLTPLADYHQNTLMVVELLEALRQVGSSAKFLLISSAAVYGNPERQPITEDSRKSPLSPYGFHKLEAELACQKYAELFGVRIAVARVFSAYGVGLRRQVVWDIARRAICDDEVRLRGTGHESRDFIHGKDVARALLAIAESTLEGGEVINVANGREVPIIELAELIVSAVAPGKRLTFTGEPSSGAPLNWCADVLRLKKLGFSPSIGFEGGVSDGAKWVRDELGP
jgi:UDP-glucose 4-epimerase